jgi:tetratricopeptide (TPR) repeat protein
MSMNPAPRLLLILPLLGSLVAGCATPTAPPAVPAAGAPGAAAPGKAPAEIKTQTSVVSAQGHEGTADELFAQGKQLMMQEKFREAAEVFDLVLRGDPDPKLAAMALMQGGLAREGAADRAEALVRYQNLVKSFPQDDLVKPALLRQGRVLIQLERWAELTSAAEGLLARPDLTISEQIESLGNRALGLIEQNELEQATLSASRARTLMEKHHVGESGRIPHEAALTFFAQGETRRVRSEQIRFEPAPPSFATAFEERAAGLLEAQSAYTDAMRTTDPFWATWAGFRVGQLYQQLHRDVMAVKPPEKITTEKDRKLYEGALQLRYRILLQKGLKMMQSTVKMNERVGETNAWGQRAREAMAQLEQAIEGANAVIKQVGVPEETLKAGMDAMAKEQAKKN